MESTISIPSHRVPKGGNPSSPTAGIYNYASHASTRLACAFARAILVPSPATPSGYAAFQRLWERSPPSRVDHRASTVPDRAVNHGQQGAEIQPGTPTPPAASSLVRRALGTRKLLDSQAHSAVSIPVTRSTPEPQVSGPGLTHWEAARRTEAVTPCTSSPHYAYIAPFSRDALPLLAGTPILERSPPAPKGDR